MTLAAVTELPRLVTASINFLGIIGGSMSVCSGVNGVIAARRNYTDLTDALNWGLTMGFVVGIPWAIVGLVVSLTGNMGAS